MKILNKIKAYYLLKKACEVELQLINNCPYQTHEMNEKEREEIKRLRDKAKKLFYG